MPSPIENFKARAYDILANREKIDEHDTAPIGALSKKDSAVLTMLGLAAERTMADLEAEMHQTLTEMHQTLSEGVTLAFDAVAASLMQFYNEGVPAELQMQNATMQRVALIMAKAGEHDRAVQGTAGDGNAPVGDEGALHDPGADQGNRDVGGTD